jgi:beta-glucoside kinase
MAKYLSFDIGGTDTKYGVLNEQGEILHKGKVKTGTRGGEIIQTVAEIKQQLARQYTFDGAAFSVPGFVDIKRGYLKTGGAISDFSDFQLKHVMEEKLALPVEVENDVNCVALAEKWLGKAKNVNDFICITLGTGIGGALFINNQLVRGHCSMAGEFGYTFITYQHGSEDKAADTMNQTASVRDGLRRRYALSKGLLNFDNLSGKDIFDLADNGDDIAIKVIHDFYKSVAVGLHNLVFTLNPEKIIIGGAISERPDLITNITLELNNLIKSLPVINNLNLSDLVSIETTSFKNNNGLIGAVYHFLVMNNYKSC